MENIPVSNASVQQCYVFETTPGVHYTVESSDNLGNWTSHDEIYGLGHEYVVTMREFTPPPPAPPGSPSATTPPPTVNSSLRMNPASGAVGGTVVSWASLDDNGPIICHITESMDAAWNLIPLYAQTFSGYSFFIWHPGTLLDPPVSNPVLGPNDSALLAAMETNLPAMNTEVANSVIASRNAPPPPPPDPDASHFWRILVDPTIDTDRDGSPDWAEFEIAARGTGVLVPGVIADPFDADTNGDGIPDGKQLDFDLDGSADAIDSDRTDNTVVFPLGPEPRYALFPITIPSSVHERASQINDKGRVLYDTGTWAGGTWTPLAAPADSEPWVTARAINDQDVILGDAERKMSDNPELSAYIMCSWSAPDAVPEFVSTVQGEQTLYATMSHDMLYGYFSPGPILSNDGHFFAGTRIWEDGRIKYQHNGFWQLSQGTGPITEEAAGGGQIYNQGADLKWGTLTETDSEGNPFVSRPPKGEVFSPGRSELPFLPTNVLSYPGSPVIALPKSFIDEQHGMVLIDGTWKVSGAYANAIDLSEDGVAIGRNFDNLKAPIYLNGKWKEITRAAPDLPEPWSGTDTTLIDTTPGGWILARTHDYPDYEYAVMLPIKVAGTHPSEFLTGTVLTRNVGVDDFSIRSVSPGTPVAERIWIMAPLDGPAKSVTMESPVKSNHPLVISAMGIDFGGADGKGVISGTGGTLTIQATTTAATGADLTADLKLTDDPEAAPQNEKSVVSVSKPIGLKVMKHRTIKVTLYKVTKITDGEPDNTADLTPDAGELQRYLNDIFLPQLNVSFEVDYADAILRLDWDRSILSNDPFAGNGRLDCTDNTPTYEQQLILAARPQPLPASNIDVFFMGTDQGISGDTWGIATNEDPEAPLSANACWIVGDTLGIWTAAEQFQTVAHEIGHVLVGAGHPDFKEDPGPAPLPGTDHSRRLMCSGDGFKIVRDSLLVKAEWDAAEEWLDANVGKGSN